MTLVAALLHDTVEDTRYTLPGLDDDFGPEVAHLVDGVTKFDKEFYGEDAEAETIRKMIVAAGKDVRVLIIKLADRLHNMRTLDARSPASRRRIAGATQEVLVPLCDRLGIQVLKRALDDVVLERLEPEAYARIDRYVRERAGWDEYVDEVTPPGRPGAAPRQARRHRAVPPPALLLDLEGHRRRRARACRYDLPRLRGHRRRAGDRLLRRAGHRARHVAAGARPVQGLHRLAEEQPLPLAAHHRHRSGRAHRRGADPHRDDAPGGRVRRRRQLPLPRPARPARRRQPGRAARLAAPGARLAAGGGRPRRSSSTRCAATWPRRRSRCSPSTAGRCCCRRERPRSTSPTSSARTSATAASARRSTAGWCRSPRRSTRATWWRSSPRTGRRGARPRRRDAGPSPRVAGLRQVAAGPDADQPLVRRAQRARHLHREQGTAGPGHDRPGAAPAGRGLAMTCRCCGCRRARLPGPGDACWWRWPTGRSTRTTWCAELIESVGPIGRRPIPAPDAPGTVSTLSLFQ